MTDQEYMTIEETIAHIRMVTRCSRSAAFRKLREALADGKLQTKWADEVENEPKSNAR